MSVENPSNNTAGLSDLERVLRGSFLGVAAFVSILILLEMWKWAIYVSAFLGSDVQYIDGLLAPVAIQGGLLSAGLWTSLWMRQWLGNWAAWLGTIIIFMVAGALVDLFDYSKKAIIIVLSALMIVYAVILVLGLIFAYSLR